MEELTASRTLRAVIDTLEAALGSGSGDGARRRTPATPRRRSALLNNGPAEEERIGRFVVQAASAPAITATAGLAGAGAVVIIDDGTGVGRARWRARSPAKGDDVRAPAASEQPLGEEQARGLAAELRGGGGVKALVHLAALAADPPCSAALDSLFVLARRPAPGPRGAAGAGGAAVLAATARRRLRRCALRRLGRRAGDARPRRPSSRARSPAS